MTMVMAYQWMGNMLFLSLGCMAVILYYQLIVKQESMLYIPKPQGYSTVDTNPQGFRSPEEQNLRYEDVYFKSPDSEQLHGWWIPASSGQTKDAPTILFCHANAGNIGFRTPNYKKMHDALGGKLNIFAFDYRGFGYSKGEPSEPGLILDAIGAAQYLVEREKEKKDVDTSKVYIFGRSLGGAVAVALAHSLECLQEEPLFKAKGIVLENTFTSVSGVVDYVFSWIPTFVKDRYLRLKWHTFERITEVKTPFLLLSGLKDEIVPAQHMQDLKTMLGDRATFVGIPEGTHNDTWEKGGQHYWNEWRSFFHPDTKG